MPNSLLITIFIISILGSAFAFAFIFSKFNENISVIKSLVFGITGYFFLYVFVSSILFFFDFFSISKAVIICFAAVFGFSVFSLINIKKFKKIKFSKKELIVFLIIVLSAVLLSGSKFGFYGMGQDQGVYQTKAIELIYGNNSNVLNFDYALKALSDSDDYTYFRNKVRELQGYYLVGQTEPFYVDENAGGESGLEGVYHGLPTWPAILALFGRMFGMGNMQQCQTVFFICYLMLVFYILENFKIKILYEITALSILGTTPLIIWISKSALTEMFLAVIMAVFVYLACHENKNARQFVWIPVTVFSVYHVSAYTFMPLFAVCGLMLFLADRRKRTVLSNVLMLFGYFWGFLFSVRLATLYTVFNYLYSVKKYISWDKKELTIFVAAVVAVCIVIFVIVPFLCKIKALNILISKLTENKGIIIKTALFLAVACAILIYAKNNKGSILNPGMNLVAMSLASGLISIPLIFGGIVFIQKEKIKGVPLISLSLIFMYIMAWLSFVRPRISYFYYYGRYDVPFLMILVVFLFVLYRDFGKAGWIPAICFSSVIMYLNYDFMIIKTPDDTKVEWEIVENELKEEKLPNSAVILEQETGTLLEWMLTLKASGVDVYPYDGDLDSQTDRLLQYYDNVYFMYEDTGEFNIEDYTTRNFEHLYTYSFIHSEDNINGSDTWTGYPEFFYSEENHTYVYLHL